AAALISALHAKTGVQLGFAQFVEASTVEAVAALVDARAGIAAEAWETAPDGPLPLTSSQQRIFAVHQLSSWSTAYNIPFAWELAPGIDVDRLVRALEQLVARHHALRAAFGAVDGVVAQRFVDDARLVVERLEAVDAHLAVT